MVCDSYGTHVCPEGLSLAPLSNGEGEVLGLVGAEVMALDLDAKETLPERQSNDARSDLIKISTFAAVSARVCLCAGIVVGDSVTGVLLWLFSLIAGGVGLLIGRTSSR